MPRKLFALAVLIPLSLAFSVTAAAEPAFEITGATSTQAVLAIRGVDLPCTLELREGSPDGPVHPDVAGVIDLNRMDTLVWNDGTRLVTLGHQRSNLALAASTVWYGTVSGCVTPAQTFSFETGTPPMGANWPRPVPFNPAKWNNADFPAIDWSPAGRDKTYVDPTTGVRLKMINHTGDFSWRSGTAVLTGFTGGEGWTSPASALAGSAGSLATTTTTNPLDLYVPANDALSVPWYDYRAIDNVGLVIWGTGTEGSGGVADRQVDICIVFDPAQGCAGTPFRVTLPTGAARHVAGSPNDPDAAWPQEFPYAAFAGWGGAVVTRDRLSLSSLGGLSAASGVLTLANPDRGSHFPSTMGPGNRITVAGAGCGPYNLCTITEVRHAGSISVAESVTGEGLLFTAYPWTIRVRKVTTSGSVSVGFRSKVSGSLISATYAEGFQCHPVEVVSADNIKGHACAIATGSASFRAVYFISDDGSVVRRISVFRIPHTKMLTTMPAADRPSTSNITPMAPYGFSPTDGRVFYVTATNSAGLRSIYKVVYNGDWVREVNYPYNGGPGGDLPEAEDYMEWSNITPPSQSKDLNSLIQAAYPNYNATMYGDWKSASFAGISGARAFFYRLYAGQDGGPCWVATLDLDQQRVISLIHTLDGTGLPEAQWGACHSVAPASWPRNTVGVSLNILASNNAGRLHGGPFEVKPAAILRGGSWSTNTALPWPIDNTYDNACPADISQEYKEFGAVRNQCVKFRLPGHPCNINPGAAEKAGFPACAWNTSFSQPAVIRPGNFFFNPVGIGYGDSEKFLVVKVEEQANGELFVTAQRNASWDYCCSGIVPADRPGAACKQIDGQLRHSDGWMIRMSAGGKNACSSGGFIAKVEPEGLDYITIIRSLGGHSTMGRNGDNIDYISGELLKRNITFHQLGAYPLSGDKMSAPSFDGVSAAIGSIVQQYLSRSQDAAGNPVDLEWAVDSNAYNGPYGITGGNFLSNTIGNRALTKVSGDIWKIAVLGGPINYKRRPLLGWVGNRMLLDVSGPQSDMASSVDYSLCHALRAGECISGSAAGETFVRAPKIYPSTGCVTAMAWARTPCVVNAQPSAGGVRQFSIAGADSTGIKTRFLTYAFGVPGILNPFFGATVHPSGKSLLVPSGQYLDGVRMASMVVQLPEFRLDSAARNKFGGLSIQLPERPGGAQGRVRFGYDIAMRCTLRNEACVTDGNPDGYSFEADATNPASCSGGCEIQVPGLSGRLVYYQAEWLDADRKVVEVGEKSAVVIP